MAATFSRAMEIMGWRVPDAQNEMDTYAENETEFSNVHEFPVKVPESSRQERNASAEATPRRNAKTDLSRIHTVKPTRFEEVREIAAMLREGSPIILNLSALDDPADARRILDFIAGVSFGVYGASDKVSRDVFLFSPPSMEIERY